MIAEALDTRAYVSPYNELVALECLYSLKGASLKNVTASTVLQGKLPSEALEDVEGMLPNFDRINTVEELIEGKIGSFSIAVNGTPGWPVKLSDSERPTPLLYYQGDLSLVESTSVSVVGARDATHDGLSRARRVARELVEAGITVVTGLARGVDTAAAQSAIDSGGRVIGVIGTPIDEVYPPENEGLQGYVAENHLLVSQVSFWQYAHEPFKSHRYHFPERNELMAAVSDASVIVEASNTSGTLTQARACLKQGRPLFIMKSLVDDGSLSWPKKFIGREGVFVLEATSQIVDAIGPSHV